MGLVCSSETEPAPGSFSQFLLNNKEDYLRAVLDGRGGEWDVVLGSESADLDSVVSAIAYSWYATTVLRRKSVALVQTPREDLKLRPENAFAYYLSSMDGNHSDILCISDVPFGPPFPSTRFTLVDHNRLHPLYMEENPEAKVVAIFDHHKDKRYHLDTAEIRMITMPLGSCASLITQYIMQKTPNVEIPQDLATLMLCAIFLDTDALRNYKKTKIDHDAAIFLLPRSTLPPQNLHALENSGDLHRLAYTLNSKMGELDDLTCVDLLRRDYKEYKFSISPNGEQLMVKLGLASVPISLTSWTRKDDCRNLVAIEKWILDQGISILGVAFLYRKGSTLKRKLIFVMKSDAFGEDTDEMEIRMWTGLESSEELKLIRLKGQRYEDLVNRRTPRKRVRAYKQLTIEATRKIISTVTRAALNGTAGDKNARPLSVTPTFLGMLADAAPPISNDETTTSTPAPDIPEIVTTPSEPVTETKETKPPPVNTGLLTPITLSEKSIIDARPPTPANEPDTLEVPGGQNDLLRVERNRVLHTSQLSIEPWMINQIATEPEAEQRDTAVSALVTETTRVDGARIGEVDSHSVSVVDSGLHQRSSVQATIGEQQKEPPSYTAPNETLQTRTATEYTSELQDWSMIETRLKEASETAVPAIVVKPAVQDPNLLSPNPRGIKQDGGSIGGIPGRTRNEVVSTASSALAAENFTASADSFDVYALREHALAELDGAPSPPSAPQGGTEKSSNLSTPGHAATASTTSIGFGYDALKLQKSNSQASQGDSIPPSPPQKPQVEKHDLETPGTHELTPSPPMLISTEEVRVVSIPPTGGFLTPPNGIFSITEGRVTPASEMSAEKLEISPEDLLVGTMWEPHEQLLARQESHGSKVPRWMKRKPSTKTAADTVVETDQIHNVEETTKQETRETVAAETETDQNLQTARITHVEAASVRGEEREVFSTVTTSVDGVPTIKLVRTPIGKIETKSREFLPERQGAQQAERNAPIPALPKAPNLEDTVNGATVAPATAPVPSKSEVALKTAGRRQSVFSAPAPVTIPNGTKSNGSRDIFSSLGTSPIKNTENAVIIPVVASISSDKGASAPPSDARTEKNLPQVVEGATATGPAHNKEIEIVSTPTVLEKGTTNNIKTTSPPATDIEVVSSSAAPAALGAATTATAIATISGTSLDTSSTENPEPPIKIGRDSIGVLGDPRQSEVVAVVPNAMANGAVPAEEKQLPDPHKEETSLHEEIELVPSSLTLATPITIPVSTTKVEQTQVDITTTTAITRIETTKEVDASDLPSVSQNKMNFEESRTHLRGVAPLPDREVIKEAVTERVAERVGEVAVKEPETISAMRIGREDSETITALAVVAEEVKTISTMAVVEPTVSATEGDACPLPTPPKQPPRKIKIMRHIPSFRSFDMEEIIEEEEEGDEETTKTREVSSQNATIAAGTPIALRNQLELEAQMSRQAGGSTKIERLLEEVSSSTASPLPGSPKIKSEDGLKSSKKKSRRKDHESKSMRSCPDSPLLSDREMTIKEEPEEEVAPVKRKKSKSRSRRSKSRSRSVVKEMADGKG